MYKLNITNVNTLKSLNVEYFHTKTQLKERLENVLEKYIDLGFNIHYEDNGFIVDKPNPISYSFQKCEFRNL